jgi:DNA-binding response OmpR family regulator
MASGNILVVEDERNISSLIELYLTKEGFTVTAVSEGESALRLLERERPSLVVLDVMLGPGIDGIEVCKRLRSKGTVPIIMLTAKDAEVDKVLGLEMGADDYMTKPFSPRELVARVKAILRRVDASEEDDHDVLVLGAVSLDVARRRVSVDGRSVSLTPMEFDLLAFLIRNNGIVFERDRLLERVWGYERVVDTRTVDSHVRSLRSKLGAAAGLVQTVRGVGYKAEGP